MSEVLARDSRQLVLDLHSCLKELDPARFRADLIHRLSDQLRSIRGRIDALLDRWPAETMAQLRTGLSRLSSTLQSVPKQAGIDESWAEFREQLQSVYEDLAAHLRGLEVHVPSLRPTNYSRNGFHVAWGLIALFLVEVVLSTNGMIIAACLFAGAGWSAEIGRRKSARINRFMMWLFGPVAHPHEKHRINSATWYATALVVISLIQSPIVAGIAVLVLGFADPAAALIGRPFGKTKLINGRSLEGTATFLAVGFMAAIGYLRLGHPEIAAAPAFGIAIAAGLAGALAELLSRRIDDNLSIPLAVAAASLAAATLFGVSL